MPRVTRPEDCILMPRRRSSRMRLDIRRFTRERIAGILIAVIALVGGVIAAAAFLTDSDVARVYSGQFKGFELYSIQTASQLEELVKRYKYVAVMFELPTCPHCKEMYPYWHRLELIQEKLGVHLYHIMYSELTRDAFLKYDVEDTPTFLFFANGKPVARHVGVFLASNVTEAMLKWLEDAKKRAESGAGGVKVERAAATNIAAEESVGQAAFLAAVAAAVAAGVVTTFSPCVLPMLIVYLSTMASRGRRLGLGECTLCGIVAAAGALAIAALFAFMGSLAASLQSTLMTVMAFVVIAVGLATALGVPMEAGTLRVKRLGLLGFCGAYGILALQCTLPLVAGALLLAAAAGSLVRGLGVALSFALGLGVTLTGVTYATVRFGSSLADRLVAKSELLTRIGGVVMFAAGLFLLYYVVSAGLI